MESRLVRFYRTPGLQPAQHLDIRQKFAEFVESEGLDAALINLRTEYCFHIESEKDVPLSEREVQILKWLLSETFEQQHFAPTSFLQVRGYPYNFSATHFQILGCCSWPS